MSLIVPFFKHKYQALYKFQWLAKSLNLVIPKFKFPYEKLDKQDPYYIKYGYEYEDDKYVDFTRARTLTLFKKEQDYASKKSITEC